MFDKSVLQEHKAWQGHAELTARRWALCPRARGLLQEQRGTRSQGTFHKAGGGQPGLDLGNGNRTLLLLQAAVELKANVRDVGQPRSPTA